MSAARPQTISSSRSAENVRAANALRTRSRIHLERPVFFVQYWSGRREAILEREFRISIPANYVYVGMHLPTCHSERQHRPDLLLDRLAIQRQDGSRAARRVTWQGFAGRDLVLRCGLNLPRLAISR